MIDTNFTDELARIGRTLAGPDREHVLKAADELARLSNEMSRLESMLAVRKTEYVSSIDEADRKALARYRLMHYGNSPEHPG